MLSCSTKTDINKIYAVQFRYRLRSVVGKFVRSLGTRMINPLDSIGNYNVDHVVLNTVDKVRDLGIYIDSKLKFAEHYKFDGC